MTNPHPDVRFRLLSSLWAITDLQERSRDGTLRPEDLPSLHETYHSIWDAVDSLRPDRDVGAVLFESEVEPFRTLNRLSDAILQDFDAPLEEMRAFLASEPWREVVRACARCLFAMLDNGVPGIAAYVATPEE